MLSWILSISYLTYHFISRSGVRRRTKTSRPWNTRIRWAHKFTPQFIKIGPHSTTFSFSPKFNCPRIHEIQPFLVKSSDDARLCSIPCWKTKLMLMNLIRSQWKNGVAEIESICKALQNEWTSFYFASQRFDNRQLSWEQFSQRRPCFVRHK